jgi:hypothetical protein
MRRALSNRLSAVEERRKPAVERPRLVVPPRDVTPEDDADFERKFEMQQMQLVRDVRSVRLKEAA